MASETASENDLEEREMVALFAREFFDRFKTTGVCCYRNPQDTANYVHALTALVSELKQKGIEMDPRQRDVTARHRLIDMTMSEIQKELIEKPRCGTRPWFFTLTRPSFTHEQLESKVGVMAQAIVHRFKGATREKSRVIELSHRSEMYSPKIRA
jgi:hypothetical protein